MIDFILKIQTEEDVQRLFGTERACQEALAAWRWPAGFRCTGCEGDSAAYLASRRTWYCTGCGRQFSVTAGTVFAHTKKPLPLWFKALWIFVHSPQVEGTDRRVSKWGGPMSVQHFMDRLGLDRYQTAWTWVQKLREWVTRLELDGPFGADFRAAVQRVMKAVGTRGNRAWGSNRSAPPKGKWHQASIARLRQAVRRPRRHPAWGQVSDWLQNLRRPPVSRKHFGRWIAEGLMRCWQDAGTDLPNSPPTALGSFPYWRLISRVHPSMRLRASWEG